MKWVMSCLHIHVFIAFGFLCLIFPARSHFISLFHYILSLILQVLPFSRTNVVSFQQVHSTVFVLLKMGSRYLALVIIRGAIRTQSNIYDGDFCKIDSAF